MLKKIDRFGFIEVDGQAFYLHWSLAGEWAEIISRKKSTYAGTIVGEYKLSGPHAEHVGKKETVMSSAGKLTSILKKFRRAKNSFSQVAG